MTTQTLELEDLVRLISDLRLAGFDVGTQQYINAQRLLFALAANGRHPARPLDLRSVLAPVLCSSPREQENFYEYFPRWLARQPHLAGGGDADDDGKTPAGGGDAKPWRGRVGPWLRGRAPLAAAAAVLLAALLIYLLAWPATTPPPPRTLSGVVVNADEGSAPVPGARVTFCRLTAGGGAAQLAADGSEAKPSAAEMKVADAEGRFAFSYRAEDAPFILTADRSGFETGRLTLNSADLQAPQVLLPLRRVPTPEPSAPSAGKPDRQPAPEPPDFTLPAPYTISGRVADGDRGVAGVTVTLTSPPGDGSADAPSESGVLATAATDADGVYAFPDLPARIRYTVAASKKNYSFAPRARSFDRLSSDRTADFAATPVPSVDFGLLRLAALGLPLALFAAWWLWRLYRHRRMLLRKNRGARPPRLEHLTVKGAAEQLFQGQAFRRTAQELRRHRRRVSHDLDERVTIEATVRRGGLFTPFYGSRKTLPEYLALIERVGARDQQARFQEELVRRLVQDSVIVDQYYFRGDPRICRRKDEGAPRPADYVTLPDLAALHPDYYLLVFSDGAGFINPVTGEPEGWLEQFTQWPGRALLTPASPAHWRAREWALRESDFLVLPLGREGLEALGEAVNMGVPPDLARRGDGRSRPFPEVLREHPRRWLRDHEPPPAKAARLVEQLRDYLGADGLDWLAACAVYPALHWDLTLYLGFELIEDRGEFERKLLAVVSLPWLRYGVMPDWLRTRLISTLAPAAERAVRRALEVLLVTVLDPPPDGVRLDYSTRRREPTPRGLKALRRRLRERLRARKRRRTLRELLRTEEEESPLQDFVFLTFMSGRRPRRLDFAVPDFLRRLLFPAGQRSFGLRPATAFACAALLSFGGWMTVSRLEPDVEGPSLLSFALPTPVPAPDATPTAETPPAETPTPAPAGATPTPTPPRDLAVIAPVVVPNIQKIPGGTALEVNLRVAGVKEVTLRQLQAVHGLANTIGMDRIQVSDSRRTILFSDLPPGVYEVTAFFDATVERDQLWFSSRVNIQSGQTSVRVELPDALSFGGASATPTPPGTPTSTPAPPDEIPPAELAAFDNLRAHFAKGQYEQAIADGEDFFRKFPDGVITDLVLLWVGRSHMELGRFQEADQVAKRLRAIPDTPFADIFDFELKEARNKLSARPTPAPTPTPPVVAITSLDIIFYTMGNSKNEGDSVSVEIFENGRSIVDSGPKDAEFTYQKLSRNELFIGLGVPFSVGDCRSLELVLKKQPPPGKPDSHQWDVQVSVVAWSPQGPPKGTSFTLLERTKTYRLGEGNKPTVRINLKCP